MKIVIGNDHTAVELKREIMDYVSSLGHEVVNYGTDESVSCNYAEYGEKVARAVSNGEFDCGILICGTGVGISLAANKVKGIRAAVCSEPVTAALQNVGGGLGSMIRISGVVAACATVHAQGKEGKLILLNFLPLTVMLILTLIAAAVLY